MFREVNTRTTHTNTLTHLTLVFREVNTRTTHTNTLTHLTLVFREVNTPATRASVITNANTQLHLWVEPFTAFSRVFSLVCFGLGSCFPPGDRIAEKCSSEGKWNYRSQGIPGIPPMKREHTTVHGLWNSLVLL